MGDGPRGIEVFPDHFQASTSGANPSQTQVLLLYIKGQILRIVWKACLARRKLRTAASMLNLFNIRKLPWVPGQDKNCQVLLTAPEVESLRTELADLEEKEALLKAQLEHLDEVLRSARLSGYLYMRTRWATLPGEPAPIDDDTEIDDWLHVF
ncbi:putative pleckstrin-like (PH) domain protein-like [Heracleum sosnowskyi]|uniref:Pleckstrin-like (PH) domain protein-like n=1 Tax=Heracleum sosnowskyi TaxID=360622 RepID=A0AAD8LUQ7_9APIA|nr:putative pleckstrin-like (PH) domain protein-like [Heracleum sosnowskyi]